MTANLDQLRCPSDAEIDAALEIAGDALLSDTAFMARVDEQVLEMHPEYWAFFESEAGPTDAQIEVLAKAALDSPMFEEALQQRVDALLLEMVTRRLQ